MPYLRAPYYVWVGHVPQLATVLAENKVEAPPMFPPTFLYTQSWEDPRPDMEVSILQHAPLCPSAVALLRAPLSHSYAGHSIPPGHASCIHSVSSPPQLTSLAECLEAPLCTCMISPQHEASAADDCRC